MKHEEPEGALAETMTPSIKAPKTREGIETLIRKLVREHNSPLLLVLKSVLSKQFHTFKKKLPAVEPFYAIKSNPHPQILKHFVGLGAGFDVASAKEIEWVLKAGAKPRNIIFANTIKSEADLKYANEHKIDLMTFDNELELYKIAKHCPKARVVLRIKVDNIGSVVQLSLKFGADPEQATYLLKKARSLGLCPEGISFHVGSQCTNINNYIQALETSAKLFAEAESVGIELKLLDIGGGFPIKYFDSEDGTVFEKMSVTLRKEIKRLFKGYDGLRIIAEPGRFFCGPAGILITQVVGKAFRDNKYYYYINDGVYQDFSGVIFDHCKYEFRSLKRGPKLLCTIAGPTCDSLDIISLTEELPELDINNVIYVKNIGAYSCASSVPSFNGFSPAKVLVI